MSYVEFELDVTYFEYGRRIFEMDGYLSSCIRNNFEPFTGPLVTYLFDGARPSKLEQLSEGDFADPVVTCAWLIPESEKRSPIRKPQLLYTIFLIVPATRFYELEKNTYLRMMMKCTDALKTTSLMKLSWRKQFV